MGLFLSSVCGGAPLLLCQFLCSIRKPVSSPRPTYTRRCRAQGPSRLAVAPTLPRAPIIARPYLDGSEHDSTLGCGRDDVLEGSPLVAHGIALTCLYSEGLEDPNHDATMRIGSEAPKRRTHSVWRHQSHARVRDPATSNRQSATRRKRANRAEAVMYASAILPSVCGTEGDTLGYHAIAHEVPQGDQELARQSDDHLLARAAGVLSAGSIPLS